MGSLIFVSTFNEAPAIGGARMVAGVRAGAMGEIDDAAVFNRAKNAEAAEDGEEIVGLKVGFEILAAGPFFDPQHVAGLVLVFIDDRGRTIELARLGRGAEIQAKLAALFEFDAAVNLENGGAL